MLRVIIMEDELNVQKDLPGLLKLIDNIEVIGVIEHYKAAINRIIFSF